MKEKLLSCLLFSGCLFVTQSAFAVKLKASFGKDDWDQQSLIRPDDDDREYRHYHKQKKAVRWVPMHFGEALPHEAVVGGFQPFPQTALYVCRGFYNGGLHPGKLYAGRCNIGWGGKEIPLHQYEVLKSRIPLRWRHYKYGVSESAVPGGSENGIPMFICRANYNGGTHPGKLYNGKCNIGWGGQEIVISSHFEILSKD